MNQTQIIGIVVGAVVIAIIAFVAFRLYKNAKPQNTGLEEDEVISVPANADTSDNLDYTFGSRISPSRTSAGVKDGDRFPDRRKYRRYEEDDEEFASGGLIADPLLIDPTPYSTWEDNGGAVPSDPADNEVVKFAEDVQDLNRETATPDPTPAYDPPSYSPPEPSYSPPEPSPSPSSSDWGSSSGSSDSGYGSSSSDYGSSSSDYGSSSSDSGSGW